MSGSATSASASRSRRCPAASGSGSSWPPIWPRRGGVYVLDEPTTGLHLADVAQLLGLLDRLVDSGKSVIVIEHHQAVMAHADWIIDLGPGAGHDGGRIVFEGTPADLVAARSTLTGQHLARPTSAPDRGTRGRGFMGHWTRRRLCRSGDEHQTRGHTTSVAIEYEVDCDMLGQRTLEGARLVRRCARAAAAAQHPVNRRGSATPAELQVCRRPGRRCSCAHAGSMEVARGDPAQL
jgi:hypothetical protein